MRYAVHIVGHTTGHMGEVTNAVKLRNLLEAEGHAAVIHNVHDLGANWRVIGRKREEASEAKARGDPVDPAYERDPRFVELQKRTSMFTRPGHVPVAYFLTRADIFKALSRMGLHKALPSISRYYPERLEKDADDTEYVKLGDVIAVISPLGAVKALRKGIPAHKIVFVPHTYPAGVDYHAKPTSEQKAEFIKQVAASMGKSIEVPSNSVLFTCLKRFEPRNNIVELIRAFREVARRNPNAFLLLKDEGWRWDEQRAEFEKLVKEVKDEPWFLWERKRDPLSTIMSRHLPMTDVSVILSGFEAASTSTIEAAAFGIPVVTLNASTHPFLFKRGAILINSLETSAVDQYKRKKPVPESKHLVEELTKLAQDAHYRKEWGKRAAQMARERFSPQRSLGRFLLASQAAYVYRNGSRDKINEMKKRVEAALHEDLKLFEVTV